METMIIEAVSNKFANKYNAGSVKAGGKWYQVSSKLDISDFQKDSQVTVETKTNDKGYTSIVGLVKEPANKVVEEAITASQTEAKTKTAKKVIKEDVSRSYEDTKGRKILVQGVTQSCANSPSLAGLPFTTVQEAANNIIALADILIGYVDEKSK